MESRLQELFQKYLSNQYSEQELDELLRYFELAEDEANLREHIRKEIQRLEVIPDQEERIDHLVAGVKQKLQDRIQPSEKPAEQLSPHKWYQQSYLWYYSAAAIVIVAIAVGLYFHRSNPIVHEIEPGGNRATLTLADGTKVKLDSAQRGIIVNTEAITYDNGRKVEGIRPKVEGEVRELVLSTPKGGQYQIILSDGSKVWLNAASTLKYPSRFSENRREVSLEGEAYFEIKEDKTKPFRVVSQKQEVLVLGTSFNISSYEREESVKTTLVTGAIQVASHAGPYALKLTPYTQKLEPGEQSIIQGDGRINKTKVDINTELAWKENKFSFDNKPFTQIMAEMGRWYNFDVTYEGPIPTEGLIGGAFRTDKLSTVLRFLKNLGLGYRVEANGNRGYHLIIINKKGGTQQ